MDLSDEALYGYVVEELQREGPRPGLMAMCFAAADGNDARARAKYLAARVEQVRAELAAKLEAELARRHAEAAAAEKARQAAEQEAKKAANHPLTIELKVRLRPVAKQMRSLGFDEAAIAEALKGRGLSGKVAADLAREVCG